MKYSVTHVKTALFVCIAMCLQSAVTIAQTDSSDSTRRSSTLADSVVLTGMNGGRYTLVSRLLDRIQKSSHDSSSFAAPRDFWEFFSKLHPVARIADSLQVSQLIELAHNTFAMIDSQAVYMAVGDADTYSAWYLQRVLGERTDVLVVALPFLMGNDYRKELCSDPHFQRAFGRHQPDSLPIPPTTAETDSARVVLVRQWLSHGKRTPLFFSPYCGLARQLEGNIRFAGLCDAYSDSVSADSLIVDDLLRKMDHFWSLKEASHGMPPEEEALRNGMMQYLSLAIMLVPYYQRSGRAGELDDLFNRLDKVCGNNWRFNALRLTFGPQQGDERRKYLQRIQDYAKAHPDDQVVAQFLEQSKDQ
jgi:hypothetical protein